MKNSLVSGILIWACAGAWGTPERVLSMDGLVMEDIKVDGLVQAWKFRKVCIDGQAYLLILGSSQAPIGISPSFKEGKPEQCKAPDPKK